MPADIPVIKPVDSPIFAIPGLKLLQVPPVVASLNIDVPPTQTEVMPVIADGTGKMVITTVAIQPVGKVYVIIAVPDDMPVTMPDEIPTVATTVLLLLQVPPPASNKAVVWPTHTMVTPVIVPGKGLTVMVIVAAHPVLNV